jgi:hypothetical protein
MRPMVAVVALRPADGASELAVGVLAQNWLIINQFGARNRQRPSIPRRDPLRRS